MSEIITGDFAGFVKICQDPNSRVLKAAEDKALANTLKGIEAEYITPESTLELLEGGTLYPLNDGSHERSIASLYVDYEGTDLATYLLYVDGSRYIFVQTDFVAGMDEAKAIAEDRAERVTHQELVPVGKELIGLQDGNVLAVFKVI